MQMPDMQLLAQQLPASTTRVLTCASTGGGLGDEEGVDVAVFRFTLGIPGFEDRLIPRVVGAVGAALLALNHILGAQPAPAAQVRHVLHAPAPQKKRTLLMA
jgi:hypothetical protein